MSHNRDFLTRIDGKAQVLQDPVRSSVPVFAICKPDILEFNPAVGCSWQCNWVFRILNDVFFIKQLENSLGGRHCALEQVVLFGEILYRSEEAPSVLEKCCKNADRDCAV